MLSTFYIAVKFKMSKKQTPSDFLKQIIGRPVVVKLNNGVDYRGNPALFYVCATCEHVSDNFSFLN